MSCSEAPSIFPDSAVACVARLHANGFVLAGRLCFKGDLCDGLKCNLGSLDNYRSHRIKRISKRNQQIMTYS